ncbi:MAG: class I SAM-dependent methyltransferase [Candidatus Aenigmatarchaeota archaeon]
MDLRDALEDELSEGELDQLITSFEVIGGIAMIEVPEELEHRKELIGEKLMEVNNHIRTVLREASERKGEFRTRDYEVIAGDEDTETIHKEYGCRFKVDPTVTYFSEREATERNRIARQVEDGETIMAMFAGIGPFPIVIARQKEVEKIYAVELNPEACHYLRENVSLNKMEDEIVPIEGDVRDVCPDYFGQCDRVLMPLPKSSHQFLELAIRCLKQEGGTVHYYTHAEETEEGLYGEAEERLRKKAEKLGKKVSFLDERKVLPYAPRQWKICLDAEFVEK